MCNIKMQPFRSLFAHLSNRIPFESHKNIILQPKKKKTNNEKKWCEKNIPKIRVFLFNLKYNQLQQHRSPIAHRHRSVLSFFQIQIPEQRYRQKFII